MQALSRQSAIPEATKGGYSKIQVLLYPPFFVYSNPYATARTRMWWYSSLFGNVLCI